MGEPRRLTIRELERLMELLARWSETHPDEGRLRDDVGYLRSHIDEEIEERTDG